MTEKGTPQGKEDDLRKRAEDAARMPDIVHALSPDAVQHTLHELRVHQIELEMQNEELRRAQDDLEVSRERYFDLYDLAPVGYVTLSDKGLILETNLKAAELLGMKRNSLVNQPLSRFVLPEDEDMLYLFLRHLSGTSGQKCELRMVRNGSAHFWARLEAATAEDGCGNPLYRIVMTDITERKQAEDALKTVHAELEQRVLERTAELAHAYDSLKKETQDRQRIEQELRQAQKMEALGTLTGGIAHDFNNILAAIIGFAELIHDHVPPESRQAHHATRVLQAGIRGRELVKQLLTFSRKTQQEKKPLQLSGIVEETVTFLRASIPTTISIKTDIQSQSGLILADPAQMRQVLTNLCTNASYAMREKGGALDIALSDLTISPSNGDPSGMKPGPYVRLVVRDTGTGMPADVMNRIFDPFFTTKKVGEGTGLGLSVVHGIVEQHDGYITVQSKPDRGSVFTLYFPQITGNAETDAVSDGEIPTGSERILFVDDEEALVDMGEDILAGLGYGVTSRTSSKDALALLKEDPFRFDLVITDQTMPEMTGIDLAKEILAIRTDIPIIMCTGFSHLVDADKAAAVGIRAFAMKPLTKREIARTIRKVLDE
jgi:PAS domain S-box-containing protein